MGWGSYATAAEMRDAIRQVVRNVINKERPKPRYGYVSTIDRDNFSATVIYEDERNEIGASPQPVSMTAVQPLDPGVRVQITGGLADRQIVAVYGPVYLADGSSTPEGGGGSHPDLTVHDLMGLATDEDASDIAIAAIDQHVIDEPHGGSGSHPDLATHSTLGLATDSEVSTAISDHLTAATHGGASSHPDVATHSASGLATDAEVTSAISAHVTAAGHAPTDATYLTTTTNGTLSAEVVVGPTPGGELAGASTTWASPKVTTTHAGSAHSDYQATSAKDAANGYPGLNSSGFVVPGKMGSGTANSTTVLHGDNVWRTVSAGSHPDLATHEGIGLASVDDVSNAVIFHGASFPHHQTFGFKGISQSWVAPWTGAIGTGTPAVGDLRLAPILLLTNMTFDELSFEVITAITSATLRIGIYSDSDNYPDDLLFDSGAIAAATIGMKTAASFTTMALGPGIFWIGGASQGAAGNYRTNGGSTTVPPMVASQGATFAPSSALHGWVQGSVTGALPATFTSTRSPIGVSPRVGMRVQ